MATLDDFVHATPTVNDWRVPELPSLAELIKSNGLSGGVQRYDELMHEWRTNLERGIIERLKVLSEQ